MVNYQYLVLTSLFSCQESHVMLQSNPISICLKNEANIPSQTILGFAGEVEIYKPFVLTKLKICNRFLELCFICPQWKTAICNEFMYSPGYFLDPNFTSYRCG